MKNIMLRQCHVIDEDWHVEIDLPRYSVYKHNSEGIMYLDLKEENRGNGYARKTTSEAARVTCWQRGEKLKDWRTFDGSVEKKT